MNLAKLLAQAPRRNFMAEQSVVCFSSKSYPLLFLSRFFAWMKKKHDFKLLCVDLAAAQEKELIPQLKTALFGQKACYWLGDISTLRESKRKQWLKLILSHTGPHTLIFFADTTLQFSLPKSGMRVELDEYISLKEYLALSSLLATSSSRKHAHFSRTLFKQHEKIPLDTAFLLMHYDSLIGSEVEEFFASWLPTMIVPEKSLFALSQHFFARNPTKFYLLWAAVKDDYAGVFWTSFWSEQLWRAYYFITLRTTGDIAQARKIGFRLPFSFINNDWKKTSCVALKQAHNMIYTIDFRLKNGGTPEFFDAMYARYFLKRLG